MVRVVEAQRKALEGLERVIDSLKREVVRLGGLVEGRGCPAGVADGGICPGMKKKRV